MLIAIYYMLNKGKKQVYFTFSLWYFMNLLL